MAGNERKTEKELQLLKVLTLSIAKAENYHTALDMCLREICKTTGWSYGEAWTSANDNKTLNISNVYYGEHEELKEFYAHSKEMVISPNTGLPGLIWQSKQPYWMKDIISDNRFVRMKLALQFNLKTALGIPVLADGKVIVAIVFFMLEFEEDKELVDMLLTIVGQLGLLFKRLSLEDNVRKVNRALRVLSDCNETIIRSTDESNLMHEICKIAVGSGGYRMALIAFAQHDAQKSIKIVSSAGFSGDYFEYLKDLTWADSQPKAALSSNVIRTGKSVIIRDIDSDPVFSPWRDAAIKQGYHSVISLPLIINNEVVGVLNMYAAEIDAFDSEEQKLLEQLANDVAYGIMSLRTTIEKEKIEKKQAQLTDIIESTTDLVVIADAQLRGIYINQGGLKLLGIEHEPDSSLDIKLFLSDDAVRILDLAIPYAVQNGTWSGESTLKREDGQLIPVSQVIIAHKSSHGKLEFVSTIARDLTEYKKLQAQLFQAQKMEAMGQLAAGVAHDFNNMLTAVVGYGNILYNKLKDNEQLRYNVAQILNASEKAASLAQDLLSFGRKHDNTLMPLDINKTITNVSDLLTKLVRESVALKIELSSEQLMVMGNRTHIEQVLMNLVGNANDAMPDGGSLTINTMVAEIDETFIKEHGYGRQGRFAYISVHDCGSGIDKDMLQKIFDPFFTTKPIGKGTGLGLSVVYSIVKQHNGYIDVHSSLGNGTTFYVYLPLREGLAG